MSEELEITESIVLWFKLRGTESVDGSFGIKKIGRRFLIIFYKGFMGEEFHTGLQSEKDRWHSGGLLCYWPVLGKLHVVWEKQKLGPIYQTWFLQA